MLTSSIDHYNYAHYGMSVQTSLGVCQETAFEKKIQRTISCLRLRMLTLLDDHDLYNYGMQSLRCYIGID